MCLCRRETVLLTVSQDLDVDKLGRVDELARNIGQDKHQVLVAYWQLRAIASSPGTFGLPYRLAAYLMMATAAAPLFFGGTVVPHIYPIRYGEKEMGNVLDLSPFQSCICLFVEG